MGIGLDNLQLGHRILKKGYQESIRKTKVPAIFKEQVEHYQPILQNSVSGEE